MRLKSPGLSTIFNVAVSVAFVLLVYFLHVSRNSLDVFTFEFMIFGFLIAGGVYLWREVLSREAVKHDERTEALAGKAARITLVAAFGIIVLILAYLTFSQRPTGPNGILAVLAGMLILVYSLTYASLERSV